MQELAGGNHFNSFDTVAGRINAGNGKVTIRLRIRPNSLCDYEKGRPDPADRDGP
jgi:hypothetical protein